MYHGDLSNGIRTQKDLYHWDLYGLFFLNVPHEGFCMDWHGIGMAPLRMGKVSPFLRRN